MAIPLLLGVDTGGTFTDFALFAEGRLTVHKRLSTPEAPEQAIIAGVTALGLRDRLADLTLIHGSTVATNAVLEGKGVTTAYITNRGLGDLLTLGRQARAELYHLQPPLLPPPVEAEWIMETGGRLSAQGEVVTPLTESDLAALTRRLTVQQPEAVAINLLFSFLDPPLEAQIAAAVPAGIFISRSSEVLPEPREYERGIATWLNSRVGPLMAGYLLRLQQQLPQATIAVMQSSATTVSAAEASRQAVRLLLSGPAGGLAGARGVAAAHGYRQLLTFDMGGTSTDVALIQGEWQLTDEGRIGRWPVAVPMVDLHTIGAGGGSLAQVDAGGLLRVGPESAGANPGPACYDQGGLQATVTDAHLVLGRLQPHLFLGGQMVLNRERAEAAIDRLAQPLGCSRQEAAEGIIAVANEQMVRALRVVSVERGVDPAQLTLVSFGGAGGLHLCALAEALQMREALVPIHAGILSALGMLLAERGRHLSQTLRRPLESVTTAELAAVVARLEAEGIAALVKEGVEAAAIERSIQLDLRYLGQSSTLTLPYTLSQPLDQPAAAFHAAHRQRYGHALDQPLELLNLRLQLTTPPPPINWHGEAEPPLAPPSSLNPTPIPIWQRSQLSQQPVQGEALIIDAVATTYLAKGWQAELLADGSLRLWR